MGPGAAAVSRITWIRATLYLKVDGSGFSSGMQNCLIHGAFNVFQTTNMSEGNDFDRDDFLRGLEGVVAGCQCATFFVLF